MSERAPRDNHTVTAGYLRRWGDERNEVDRHDLRGGIERKGPRAFGYQRDYWGTDPDLAREMEEKFQRAEKLALDVLADLPSRWPLKGDDRGLLTELLAIHIVRMPAFSGYSRQLGEQANRETMAEGAPKHGLDEAQAAVYAELLRSDRVHADSLLRQIPRVGSALGSMHWTLVEFPVDWLITSDEPVVMLGAPPHAVSPASAIGPYPFNAVEARFTLDPRRVLLLTWLDDADEPWLTGQREHACSVNGALKAQALEEWFSKPGTTPPFIAGPTLAPEILLVSTGLLRGYTVQHADGSVRRQQADSIVKKMVGEQPPPKEMIFVTAKPKGASARAT